MDRHDMEWVVFGAVEDSAGNWVKVVPDPLPDSATREALRRKLRGEE